MTRIFILILLGMGWPCLAWSGGVNFNDTTVLPVSSVNPSFTGNVGINTVVPGAALQIGDGAQSLSASLASDSLLIKGPLEVDGRIYGNGSNLTGLANIGGWSASGSVLYNALGGNVGIGSSVPSRMLDVAGSAKFNSAEWGSYGMFTVKGVGYDILNIHPGDDFIVFAATAGTYLIGGNVGIGTDAPTARLVVARGDGGGTQTTVRVNHTGSGPEIEADARATEVNVRAWSTTLDLQTTGNDTLMNTAGGNVGINSANPTRKLHVDGTAAGAAGIYLNSAVPASTAYTLYNNGGTLMWNGAAVGAAGAAVSGTATYLSKFTAATTVGNSSIIETAGGSITLGTTSPDAALTITPFDGGFWDEGIVINPAPTGGFANVFFRDAPGSLVESWRLGRSGTNGYFFAARNGLTGMTGTSRADAPWEFQTTTGYAIFGGNVGIHTASPQHRLDVNTWMRVSQGYYFYHSGAGETQVLLRSTGNYGTIQNDAANVFSLGYRTTAGSGVGTPVLTWTTGGNVGIGSLAPSASLDVNGPVKIGTNGTAITKYMSTTTTWDPANIATGAATTTSVTLTGAASGDLCVAGHDQASASGLILTCAVTSSNTVSVTLFNMNAAAQNVASGTLRVSVFQN